MDFIQQMTLLKNTNKKIIYFCFLLLFYSNSTGKDNICHEANNLISSNFWSLIPTDNIIFYNLNYFRKINCKNTLGIDLKYPANKNIKGYSIGVEYRYYMFSNALDGFYIASGISNSKLSEDGKSQIVEIYSFDILAAYSIIFGKHFTLDLGLGLKYNTGPYLQNQELQSGYSNTLPNIRFAIGWAF